MSKFLTTTAVAAILAASLGGAHAQESVEVLHRWA